MVATQLGQVRAEVRPDILCRLGDMFQVAGDVHATFYAGSRAMHSAMMSLLTDPPEGAGGRSSHGLMVREKTRQVGATMTNMALSVQRRFQNVVQDGDKQLQLDLFVGREVLDAS